MRGLNYAELAVLELVVSDDDDTCCCDVAPVAATDRLVARGLLTESTECDDDGEWEVIEITPLGRLILAAVKGHS